jgi:hypothetical protein
VHGRRISCAQSVNAFFCAAAPICDALRRTQAAHDASIRALMGKGCFSRRTENDEISGEGAQC